MTHEIQVDLRQVTKRYESTIGVQDLSLQVRKGEFLSLLGPSGCGKSTTLRLIAGFEQADAGEVTIAGRPMHRVPPYSRNIGIVFQSYALFPHLDVFENVAFGLRTRKVGGAELKRRVDRALAMVELEALGKRRPHQLSGGQQQRVALARAVVIEPDVLLLDEPLGALDKKLRENMQLRLTELHRALDITTIYVTHDQEEALTMSDRIAVMNSDVHGIVQLDTPYELYHHPSSLFVANFIGTSSTLEDRVMRRDGDVLTTARGFTVGVTRDDPIVTGDLVAIALRPEKLTIELRGQSSSNQPNAMSGEVSGVVFLGDSTTYVVQAESVQLRVKQFQVNGGAHLAVGNPVTVSWRQNDARAFKA